MDIKRKPFVGGLIISAIAVLVLLTAGTVYASGPATGPTWWGVPQVKWWDLLWRALNFGVLVLILVKFAAKPIGNILKARQSSIKEQFEDLEAKRAEADKAYQEYDQKLSQIDQEIKNIIAAAVAHGEAEKERIIAEANRAAGDIKRQAEMAVQHEIAAIKHELREEVANQAVLMAEELIKKNLQQDDQVKLIEDYLEKVGTVQ